MKALIVNSGVGSRMGDLTKSNHKSLVKLSSGETILGRQIRLLSNLGISEFVITTGAFADDVEQVAKEAAPGVDFTFIHNSDYITTNYIYSIYLAAQYLTGSILLLHGDLVFSEEVLEGLLNDMTISRVIVDSSLEIDNKDFKVEIDPMSNRVLQVGIDLRENAISSQPMYFLCAEDWSVWLNSIVRFCELGNTSVYAESALNEVSNEISLEQYDIRGKLCSEIDTVEDLMSVNLRLKGE